MKVNPPQQFRARSNIDWVTLFWDEEEKLFSCTNTSPAACQENKPGPIVFIIIDVAINTLQERARRRRLWKKAAVKVHKTVVQVHPWHG